MENEREILALAALLHDIGKFMVRADVPLEAEFRDYEEKDIGKHGAHAKWSAAFVSENLPHPFKQAFWPVLYHHNPNAPDLKNQPDMQKLTLLLQKADHLASVERRERSEKGKKESRLYAILAQISLWNSSHPSDWVIPRGTLTPQRDTIFPLKESQEIQDTSYPDLWDHFQKEFQKWFLHINPKEKNFDFYAFYQRLLTIFYKYTWSIPGAYYGVKPDISLYDHSKATAAVAVCLYENSGEEKFTLIGGDLTGIQSFLYHIASPQEAQQGMAKRLRGRSFYLSLLTETIAEYILRELNLLPPNLLWVGGGNFLILAPAKVDIHQLKRKIQQWLLEEFQAKLGVVIASVQISGDGLRNFAQSMDQLHHELNREKHRKFIELDSWPQGFPLKTLVCPVCGADYDEVELKDAESESSVCPACHIHEKIGQAIPYLEALILVPENGSLNGHENSQYLTVPFEPLGFRWYFVTEWVGWTENLPPSAIIYLINHLDLPPINTSVGITVKWIAKYAPTREDGVVKSFEEISASSQGGNFLAALRMDVDNLGKIFTEGLQDDYSISRISALSRSVDLFFSGYLNTLAEQFENLYTLYAGGDDLFVVGPWQDIIAFAGTVDREFFHYAGDHPDLHLSGGIFLFKPGYPIGIAAELSGKKEKLAKSFKRKENVPSTHKHALHAFEYTLPFEHFDDDFHLAETLVKRISEKQLSRRFLYQLWQIYRHHFTNNGIDIAWLAKFRYHLIRNVDPTKSEEKKKLFVFLQEKIDQAQMERAPFWVQYALFYTRELKK